MKHLVNEDLLTFAENLSALTGIALPQIRDCILDFGIGGLPKMGEALAKTAEQKKRFDAVFELCALQKRLKAERGGVYVLNDPLRVEHYVSSFLQEECEQEVLLAVCVNTAQVVLGTKIVSKGSINSSLIPTPVILRAAALYNAPNLFLVHNHPSGSTKPSQEDFAAFEKLYFALSVSDMQLQDFLIVGNGVYSFLQEGHFDNVRRRYRDFLTGSAAKAVNGKADTFTQPALRQGRSR
jgi:DNA repair protein RadC